MSEKRYTTNIAGDGKEGNSVRHWKTSKSELGESSEQDSISKTCKQNNLSWVLEECWTALSSAKQRC